jgi:hypothetical protein
MSENSTDEASEMVDVSTRFKKGNKFWEARSSHGRKPIFSDPEKFLDACYQYFQWVEENPLIEEKPMIEGGLITPSHTPKMRAMTITAIARYVGMSFKCWQDYKGRAGFSDIIDEVEDVIRDQKLAGAAAGMLNANIIARDLGLKDSTETDITSGGKTIKNDWHIHPVTTNKDGS